MNTSADAVGKGPERQHVAALKLVGQILLIWVAIWFGSLLISFMAWKVFGFINDRDTKLFAQVIAGVGCFLLASWKVAGFWRRKGLAMTPGILIHLFGGFLLISTPLPAFALVVPFVSLFVALMLPGGATAEDAVGMKTCPFCAEDIKAAAIACRHCGRDLPRDAQSPVAASSSTGASPP